MIHRWKVAARRVVGALWLGAWGVALVFLLDLWSKLGGLVDEHVRWCARMGLALGPVVGWALGLHARELAGWGSGRSHAGLLRLFWIPPGAIVAIALAGLTVEGRHDEARALFGTLCGYWAGFDAAIAAWPLLCGRPYRFIRDIPPEVASEENDPDPSFWGRV